MSLLAHLCNKLHKDMNMKNNETDMQFKLSYAGDSRFASMLEDPSFSIVLELPSADEPASIKELLKYVGETPSVFAVALLDGSDIAPEKRQLDFAEEAIAVTAKPVISYVSGRGKSYEDVRSVINSLRTLGLRDFVAVTGDFRKGTASYMDSLDIISAISETGDDNCIGGVVNPFKYLHEDQFFQYCKLIGKVNAGARFIVAQAGWDMKKYQELIWFLRSREILVPAMARICVIDTSDEGLLSMGIHPGVSVPLHIAAAAQRSASDAARFTAEQAHTAAFVAAGCRLMGFNGIQLSGIHTAGELEAFLDEFNGILEKYPTFEAWATAWNETYNEIAFVPVMPNLGKKPPFYLYGSLMVPEIQAYDAKDAMSSEDAIPSPSFADKLRYYFLARQSTPECLRRAAKWLARCKYTDAQLDGCLGLNPDSCPKRLLKGPCGNCGPDGICETGEGLCIFQRIARLALKNGLVSKLEGEKH